MNSFEILPYDFQLDTLIANNYDEITLLVDAEKDKHSQSFIDSDVELNNTPFMILDTTDVWTLGLNDDTLSSSARFAAYNAFFFALTVGNIAIPDNRPARFVPFDNDLKLVDLLPRSQEYLQHREAVDRIIGHYIDCLDPSGRDGHIAEAAASITFEGIEHAIREDYVNKEVELMNVRVAAAGDSLYDRLADRTYDI